MNELFHEVEIEIISIGKMFPVDTTFSVSRYRYDTVGELT